MEWDLRQGKSRIAPEQPLGIERLEQLRPTRRQLAEQRGDVHLGQDEADLALGPVEVERAPQDHHHPLRELDALLGQPVPERGPRTAPALDVEGGHAAAAPVTPGDVVLGVDEAHEEVARPVIRDVLDFASDPEVAVTGKGLVERTLDLLVDATDGVDPAAVLRLGPAGSSPARRGGVLRRSLGIEELTGAAGHRRHPTDALSGHLHGPVVALCPVTVSRPGGRGTGRSCGTVSRKVGTPQSRVLANGQSGRPAGQCHRKETADGGPPGPHR